MIVQTKPRKAGAPKPPALALNEARALGDAIRRQRKQLNLDQRELAFAANVSPRTVFAIEKGKPTVRIDMLIRVLAAVGLKLTIEPRDRMWRP
jgi:y4mF family transcriptional regulator